MAVASARMEGGQLASSQARASVRNVSRSLIFLTIAALKGRFQLQL
jgi:hypothetical protein